MDATLVYYTTASGIERARVPVLSCSSDVHFLYDSKLPSGAGTIKTDPV